MVTCHKEQIRKPVKNVSPITMSKANLQLNDIECGNKKSAAENNDFLHQVFVRVNFISINQDVSRSSFMYSCSARRDRPKCLVDAKAEVARPLRSSLKQYFIHHVRQILKEVVQNNEKKHVICHLVSPPPSNGTFSSHIIALLFFLIYESYIHETDITLGPNKKYPF